MPAAKSFRGAAGTARHKRPLFGLVLCTAVIGAGCRPAAHAPPPDAGRGKTPLEVVTAGHPLRKTLTLVTVQPARIEGLEQTPVHSRLAAYVGEVHADFGDRVRRGQPLITLRSPELDAEAALGRSLQEQARAELKQSEAGRDAAQAAIATAEARVGQSEAARRRAEADVERWRSEMARIEQLADLGSINRKIVDETQQQTRAAEATLQESLAAVAAAQATAQEARAGLAKAAADVAAAQARLGVAEARSAQTQAMVDYLDIRSPFDGVITARRVDPGHFVLPATGSASPLMVVTRDDKLRIFVAVSEADAAYVDVGDAVTVAVPSLRGLEVPARVTRTSVALDSDSRSLQTMVDVENPEGQLRPGQYATVRIVLQEQADALTLPAAAVVRQGHEAFCYKLTGGKAVRTPIQLGLKVADLFEITEGLSDADLVILTKASMLKDGQAVEQSRSEGMAPG